MNLSDLFTAVAHKELVPVDLPHAGSNQHELNGVAALRSFFGTSETTRGRIHWRYFVDDRETVEGEDDFTFYDARARSSDRTGRSEWRFYYSGCFIGNAVAGDLLVLVRTRTGRIFGLLFQRGSAWERAARELFALPKTPTAFSKIPNPVLQSQQLELLRRQILDQLDLHLELPIAPTDEELVLQKFGRSFPTSREMSDFARTQTEIDFPDPDACLTRWLEREEQLFRALERAIIGERLRLGFRDVEDFIQYSLSVQNRRKSRMGLALQNHLAELFTRCGIRFAAQARTEHNNRPDFIFPGEHEYHDPSFDAGRLLMLAVKATSKDRWRQVLTEADRIPAKHLCTLEPGISVTQTNEMRRHRLTLVVPSSLHATYTAAQRHTLLSVTAFIELVAAREGRTRMPPEPR